jgi:hypothetical protein
MASAIKLTSCHSRHYRVPNASSLSLLADEHVRGLARLRPVSDIRKSTTFATYPTVVEADLDVSPGISLPAQVHFINDCFDIHNVEVRHTPHIPEAISRVRILTVLDYYSEPFPLGIVYLRP